ncbi:Leucine-rich repeat protein [Metarhizium album ARSEF 1941]|uniref:Leucine-rich repeat protein n=1 Tax=Metarhizium album (strain ARSEF 1941) TaxID=1081103 RepID=A0A0B2WZ67_METAS|nr:Leucine-rich repeat protein [Metarhizium album ARSEF 1941]KHO01592.1 Leucine-rich repeat protein [Metarhizium album ARSEF 1941]
MKTLAQIPPSPALSKKSSSLFEHGRPRSQAGGGNSRPGSSYNSDGSAGAPSRQGSRPGSSAGQDDHSAAFCASGNPFKRSLSTNSGTPRKTSAIVVAKTPQTRASPSRASHASSTKLDSIRMSSSEDAASTYPEKTKFEKRSIMPGSKSVTSRPTKPRASATGLIKKPSLPSVSKAAGAPPESWDGAIPPAPAASSPMGSTPLTNRKSSAALREQIAKAKAAKRAAVRQSSANRESIGASTMSSIAANGFDMEHDDPFNLSKGAKPSAQLLQQRVAAARTTGRLNIAALGLKEIPQEVVRMYDLESIDSYDGTWAESVDLTRLVAADNDIECLDENIFPDASPGMFDEQEGQGNIFGGLETLDMHGNLLTHIPLGFRRLANLTSLNLSSNKLENDSLDIISQMPSLRDLKLSKNQLSGPLNSALMSLSCLEMLDIHGNGISALPPVVENMQRLRILNMNENKLESLPFESLSKLPLTELSVRKNRLSGVLIQEPVDSLPCLQSLDASVNQLTHLTPVDSVISLPVIHAISLSVNRLQCLPDMSTWTNLLTLSVDENHIANIPDSFTGLQKLRYADFGSNDVRIVPPEIARMQSLSMIRLTGNPLRDRKLVSAATDELKEILAGRLEPPPPYQEPGHHTAVTGLMGSLSEMDDRLKAAGHVDPIPPSNDEDVRSDVEDNFTTPPTSAPHTPNRSRSQTVVKDVWFVKSGGLLDLSRCGMSSLNPSTCSTVASQNQVRQVQLHHNPIASMPIALGAFGSTLSFLSLAHTQITGISYLTETLELPALRELSLLSNQITSLTPLAKFLKAPTLEKLDVTLNRVRSLSGALKQAFPRLSVLLVASNQLSELDPEWIRGLKIVDVSCNNIDQLNARLGLLGGVDGLERLEVSGNRFRVPRWSVLERGTEATLRWLRGRLPNEEMAAWRAANSEDSGEDVD